jgi:hypothetical protein
LLILIAISLFEQPRSRSWEDCVGMGLVRENPVKEEVIEKLLESLRVNVSFASGLAPQLHRLSRGNGLRVPASTT